MVREKEILKEEIHRAQTLPHINQVSQHGSNNAISYNSTPCPMQHSNSKKYGGSFTCVFQKKTQCLQNVPRDSQHREGNSGKQVLGTC
jgi:hypothetical protein